MKCKECNSDHPKLYMQGRYCDACFHGIYLRDRSVVDQEPHKLRVAGSIPAPATTSSGASWLRRILFSLLQSRAKSEAPRSRTHLLNQVRPVCSELSEPRAVIPPGALALTLRRVA